MREQERLRREDPLSFMSSSLSIFSSNKTSVIKEWGGCASEDENDDQVGEAAKRLLEGLSEKEKAALLATLSGKEDNATKWTDSVDYSVEWGDAVRKKIFQVKQTSEETM